MYYLNVTGLQDLLCTSKENDKRVVPVLNFLWTSYKNLFYWYYLPINYMDYLWGAQHFLIRNVIYHITKEKYISFLKLLGTIRLDHEHHTAPHLHCYIFCIAHSVKLAV